MFHFSFAPEPVRRRASVLLAATALFLTACGGGGGGDAGVGPGPGVGTNPLAVSVAGGGSVSSTPAGISCGATCSAQFSANSSVTLTATPAAGQVFGGWGGDCAGSLPTCTVPMQAARTVTASFNAPAPSTFTLDVSVSAGGTLRSVPAGIDCGSSCNAAFPAGATVVLNALPASGQVLTGWGGACTGAGTSCTVNMSQARSVSATFGPAPVVLRTLSVTLTGGGLVRSQPVGLDCGTVCSADFGNNTPVVLTATPAAGQRFSAWSGACTGTSAICTVTLGANQSVGATFVAAAPPLAWQPPQLMEASEDFNVGNRVLTALAPNGNAMVMWEQSDGLPSGSTLKVYSRRYVAGVGWDAAVQVPGVSTSSSSVALVEGALLMDAAGTATWLRPNLETRRFTAASGWGSPFVPSALAAGLLSDAVMNAAGDIGVVTAGSDVYNIALAANANSWGTWARVDASATRPARSASVAISADGTAMAIWSEGNPGDSNYSMKAARYVNGWQTPVTIDNSFDSVNNDSQPRVTMDAAGNAIAVWHQGDDLYYNVFSASSGWGSAVQVDANAVDSNFQARIRVAMTPTGWAVVIWNSGLFAVKSMQYTPGAGFSAPAVVNSYGISGQLGVDADGNATVVYLAPDRWPNPTTGLDAYARQLPWGGSWSSAAALEPLDGIALTQVAQFNQAGQGMVAWVRGDAAGSSSRKSLWVSVLR